MAKKYNKINQTNTVIKWVRVDDKMATQLEEVAKRTNFSQSAIVYIALREYLDRFLGT